MRDCARYLALAELHHSSLIGTAASAWPRKPMICSYVNLLFFKSSFSRGLTDSTNFSLVRLVGGRSARLGCLALTVVASIAVGQAFGQPVEFGSNLTLSVSPETQAFPLKKNLQMTILFWQQ